MNWLKRKLYKWFGNDEIDEFDNEDEEYDKEEEEWQNTAYNQNESKERRKNFRFPLIADEEIKGPNNESTNREIKNFHHSYSNTPTQKTIDSQVYDVEVSRIAELLEMRRQKKNVTRNSVSVPKKTQEMIRHREMKETLPNERQIRNEYQRTKKSENQPSIKQEMNIPQNRKRFIPTDVPSPVYGFQKRNANELVKQKQLEEQKNAEKDEKEVGSSLENQIKSTQKATTHHSVVEEVAATTVIDEIDKKLEQVKEEVEQIISQPLEKLSITIEDESQENRQEVLKEQTTPIVLEKMHQNETTFEKMEGAEDENLTIQEIPSLEEAPTESIDMAKENFAEAFIQQSNQDEIPQVEISEHIEKVVEYEEKSSNDEDFSNQEIILLEDSEVETSSIEKNEDIEKIEQVEKNEEVLLMTDIQKNEMTPTIEMELNDVTRISHEEQDEMENQSSSAFSNAENIVSSEEIRHEHTTKKVTTSRERIVPFNVVMLKSDKEKLTKRVFVENLKLQAQKASKKRNTVSSFQKLNQEVKSIQKVELGQRIEPVQGTVFVQDAEPAQEIRSIPEVESAQQAEFIQELEVIQKGELVQITESNQATESVQKVELIQENEYNQDSEPTREVQEERKTYGYVKPSLDYLTPPEQSIEDREWMEAQADVLVEALSYFQVKANVESIMQGPAVTQFEITVGHGTKVSKIRNLADDLKLALAAKDIRIQAPIPGKSTIGIEIPNRISRPVRLSEVVNSEVFLQSESPLEAALGLDLTGKPVTIDLRKMPHGLIAGATGSGKSVCINSILVSLLLKAEPNELKLMLIDPKMVELAPFNHIPHLVSPVITDVKAANAALKWAVDEMERRYQLFAHAGVRDLPRYNQLVEKEGKYSLKLPYILIVIDELADLMMMAPQDVEESICRIAQKARACGIHLIIATQRPSVDVITGLIKSNIPTRIAFAVSSQIDSRTILDNQGAERLLGRGDMLYVGNGMTAPIRLQGTFVTDDEIDLIIEHVKEQGEPDYFFEQEELLKKSEMIEEQDELFEDVCRFVYEQGSVSASLIQRKYHIGYNRAARLIETLESYGFISEQKGSKPREVYITESDLAEMFD